MTHQEERLAEHRRLLAREGVRATVVDLETHVVIERSKLVVLQNEESALIDRLSAAYEESGAVWQSAKADGVRECLRELRQLIREADEAQGVQT